MVVPPDLVAADQALLKALDDALSEGARKAGRHLACQLACTECCLGPFPITQLDAWRLRRGLAELSARDPLAAARVRERSRTALRRMSPGFPGDADSGLLAGEEEREEEFFARHAARPCPVLNPVSGACDLYAWRPVSCRTFGLPVLTGNGAEPPCRLCFQGAAEAEIEACRVVIDPGGIEDAILTQMEAAGFPEAHTLVAWAVLDRGRRDTLGMWEAARS
jgi:Fe-S-cluster containining protein